MALDPIFPLFLLTQQVYLVPDIERSYGRTYEKYSPLDAHKMITRLFDEFNEKYASLFS